MYKLRYNTILVHRGIIETLPTLWISRSHALLQLGDTDAAIALCRKARKVAAHTHDYDALVGVGYSLTRIYLYAGRLNASLATANRTLNASAGATWF